MPLFMDRHSLGDVTVTGEELAQAHLADLAVQDKYGAHYLTYWFDDKAGSAFCLVEAPSKENAEAVHRESHGLVASEILEVNIGVVEDFLGRIQDTPAAIDPATTTPESALRTIFYTDMEGSTSMTQRLGDARAMEILQAHDTVIRGALQSCGGREVKHTGDGIMASFASVSRAIECAVAVQRGLVAHNLAHPDHGIRVRIGLSAGEPLANDRDLFGTAVQLAARVCNHAEPGQILAPDVVRQLAAGKSFLFADRGAVPLKGFEEPVRLFEVRWQE
jgi:class 3 adenylate cyclase